MAKSFSYGKRKPVTVKEPGRRPRRASLADFGDAVVTDAASSGATSGLRAIEAVLQIRKLVDARPSEHVVDALKRCLSQVCTNYIEQLNKVRAELIEERAKVRRMKTSGESLGSYALMQRLRDAIAPGIEADNTPDLLAKLVERVESDQLEAKRPAAPVMGFNAYQALTRRTVQFSMPMRERMAQFAMGAAGEAGELCEVVKKHLFHDARNVRDRVREEAGDALWYIAQTLDQFGISLQSAAEFNVTKTETHHAKG